MVVPKAGAVPAASAQRLKDDVFPPVSVRVSIPSLTARWTGGRTDGPERTVTTSGHGGRYSITYDWRLFA